MRPVLTPEETTRVDAAAIDDSATGAELMERAGLAVALAAVRLGAEYGRKVVVLVGPGNNGGDGYVAARRLHERGVDVEVLVLADPRTPTAAAAAGAARSAGVRVNPWRAPDDRADVVVDALFGGGFRRGLPPEVGEWFAVTAPVVAVDVPSGLDPATGEVAEGCFPATTTVTFHTLEPGHLFGVGPDVCGEVVVVDIGLRGGNPVFGVVEDADAPRPPRGRRGHKWSVGSVLVVGGSPGMVGAAVLAGRAALSFGAGAVGVASPDPSLVQGIAPELLAYPLDALPGRYDVWIVGPGLGTGHGRIVEEALARRGPLVLDADALGSVDVSALAGATADVVVTPHAGEFAALFGSVLEPWAVAPAAATGGVVVVAKGNPTIVSDGGLPRVVTSNGPELATIGTGDVLAGMIGALLARRLDPLTAAVSAAHWHGVAGARVAARGTVTADVLSRRVAELAWEAG